ncbi:hypothetical protein [Pseudochrobactrum kiredjianiae]|uniref:Uncharacterized protein n=1 Tax=Pseudochrobactrum kiredjianiae TaxID=386305 RepID=A0ABW3V3A8_9HYPH|nr:hypothetical protein [Pseudochrobactrum kiredjianiae]MDM7851173.1 hypothetical protein [Pseudochrobactrum kiredjianiae]
MPEDTSDDSSITDCCHFKSVTIRNQSLLHVEYRRNRSLSYQAFVLPVVHVSRFAKKMHGRAAAWPAMIARQISEKETGLRDKILLFFEVFCKNSLRIPEGVSGRDYSDFTRSEQKHSAIEHFRFAIFKGDIGTALNRFLETVYRADPVLARLSGLKLAHNRIPQQKF